MICASEQAVILDEEVYERGLAEFERLGAYVLSAAEKTKLEEFVFGATAFAEQLRRCQAQRRRRRQVSAVDRRTSRLRGAARPPRSCSPSARRSARASRSPARSSPRSWPPSRPTPPSTASNSRPQMVEFHGLGHSAAIHTEDDELAEEFGRRVKAIRVIVNAPSTFGGIGDVYNAFLPSLTLGCGCYGHNSVSDNVSAVNLVNIKRIGRRNNNMQWFKVPPKIYFERNSIRYLGEMDGLERVTIVTDKTMGRLGFVQKVSDILQARPGPVVLQVIDDVEPNPELATVWTGRRDDARLPSRTRSSRSAAARPWTRPRSCG